MLRMLPGTVFWRSRRWCVAHLACNYRMRFKVPAGEKLVVEAHATVFRSNLPRPGGDGAHSVALKAAGMPDLA